MSRSVFWDNLIRAAEADPREVSSIRGVSGLDHPVLSVGVDDKRNRLLVVSGEPDARSAAMAHADIQSASEHVRVVFARPVAVNIADAALNLSSVFGHTTIGPQELLKLTDPKVVNNLINPLIERIVSTFGLAPLNLSAQLMQVIQQLSVVEVEAPKGETAITDSGSISLGEQFSIKLEKLIQTDPTERDRFLGLCPIPLYDFSPEEIEIFQSGTDLEAIRELLRAHELLQYFFPPPDQLALGLIDRGITNEEQLTNQLEQVPSLGHPYGPMEITQSESLADVIDNLKDRGLVVEGEVGYEVTPEGTSTRATVTFKPRESLISKILNRFSVNLDLKDLWKP